MTQSKETQSTDTIFGRIATHQIPADIVYETERVIAFRDIAPHAPVHILVIPKKGIRNITSLEDDDKDLLGELLLAARDIAKAEGLTNGLRLVINEGEDAGQSVAHLHVHILGGRAMGWPPG